MTISPEALKAGWHARRLVELLSGRARLSPLTILTHDHPDPDSLASAWALALLAQGLGKIRARIVFGGVIGRAENRLMAERLAIPAYPLRRGELAAAAHVALVDTQPPFRNNRFPALRRADLVIDHHPRHSGTQAETALIDESVGATTTMLAEALSLSGLKVPRRLATAIVYGIGSETQNLGREATERDLEAYKAFWPRASMRTLWRISYPKRSQDFFVDLARGIRNAFIVGPVIGVHMGALQTPDRVAQMADFLLTHEDARWSIVTGRFHGRLHVSLRAARPGARAGRLLKRLLGGGNRGGGHTMIAGGSLEVGEEASELQWHHAEEGVVSAFLQSQGAKDPSLRLYPFRGGTA
ncbi:MAG: DHH family phosphoesterase [Elusimicrobia bacterium]|nr:DHH family phosphoesterase [Elusimicrobiota bacterium]MDE2236375.1 DHH family phosphoesterase [Elusimicrobiota bacterium]MDE2424771.1 DHH family phosphoesterase [Elusimicrobiota bacterium]